MEPSMNEDLNDEEQYSRLKRPSTGLAKKYAQKQLKEENILSKLLEAQTKVYGKVQMTESGDLITVKSEVKAQPLSLTEARNIALQSSSKYKEVNNLEDITLNEAIDLAITENWKENQQNMIRK